jgi:hypothetical protein
MHPRGKPRLEPQAARLNSLAVLSTACRLSPKLVHIGVRGKQPQ